MLDGLVGKKIDTKKTKDKDEIVVVALHDGSDLVKINKTLYYNSKVLNGLTTYSDPNRLELFFGLFYDKSTPASTPATEKFDYITDINSVKKLLFQYITFSLLFKTWGDMSNILSPLIIQILTNVPSYWEIYKTKNNINDVDTIGDGKGNATLKILKSKVLRFLNSFNIYTSDDTCAVLIANIISGVSGVRTGETSTDFSLLHLNRTFEQSLSYNCQENTVNKIDNIRKKLSELLNYSNTDAKNKTKLTYFEDIVIENRFKNSDDNIFNKLNGLYSNGDDNFNLKGVIIDGNDKQIFVKESREIINELQTQNVLSDELEKNILQKYKNYFDTFIDYTSTKGIKDVFDKTDVQIYCKNIKNTTDLKTLRDIFKIIYEDPMKSCGKHSSKGTLQQNIKKNVYALIRLHNLYRSDDITFEDICTKNNFDDVKFKLKKYEKSGDCNYSYFKKPDTPPTEFKSFETNIKVNFSFNANGDLLYNKSSTNASQDNINIYTDFPWKY